MKFGHTLLTHQVPEWQQHYMDYKGLKKIVKAIHLKEIELRAEDANTDVFNDSQIKLDLARFFFHIDSNVEIVDDFYAKKYSDYEKRLKKIMAVFPTNNAATADLEEYDDLVDILLELRNCFRNLKWYAELNRRGFVKILKKLDKKAGTKKKDFYLQTKVYPLSFCNESELVKCLSLINDYLNILSTAHEINNHVIFPTKNMVSTSSSSSISNLDINPAATSNPLLSTESLRLPPPSSMIINSKSNTKHSNLNIYLSSIYGDDADQLESVLIKEYMSPVLAPIKLLLSLLNKSTLELSYKCIDLLLKIIPALLDSSDVSGRSFIHHHVIALGKKNFNRISNDYNIGQLKKTDYNSSLFYTYGSDGINSNDFAKGLLYIFQNLPAHLKFAILQKDNYKRTPLHYASQYGLKEVTFIILKFLKEWGMYNDKISLDDVTHWGDSENLTPVHLAVLGKHPKTTQTLIDAIDENVALTCPYLLHVATRMNTPGLLQCLLRCKGININGYESEQSKETALYVAAKYDLRDSAESLIKNGADTEIGEASFGWTPIFVAAAHGYVDIIDLLISNGAKYYIQDESGWTPREHAALRGHIDIVSKLTPPNFDPYESLESKLISPILSPKLQVRNNSSSSIHRIPDIKRKTPEPQPEKIDLKQLKQGNLISPYFQSMSANKTIVGNRYLKKGESVILITIGTTDLRDITPAIELYKIPLSKIHSTELDSALSIVISPSNIPDQPSYPLALPLDDNHGSSSDPITFHLNGQDPLDTLIYFDIIPTFDVEMNDSKHKSKKVLGRAVAILKNMHTSVGPNKRSLFNCVKIPILEVNTLEVLGTIKFEILIVKSFEENGKIPADADIYCKSLVQPRLIGHRGNGMNSRNKKSLQLGENTVESFIAAASLGAQYVEFDVQLTKDDVPVVYHDFIIAESGIDIPMHLLTLEQFMHLNSGRDKAQSDRKKIFKDDSDIYKKSRSKSVSYKSESGSPINGFKSIDDKISRNFGDDDENEDINPDHERMKLTKTWKAKEFKANTRGSTIASSFTTLEELFKKVPKSAGFNIELKYPMLDESQLDDIGQTAPEMNHFCDKILSLVYEHYLGRNVIFSSFHPDICMIMTMKQPSFPVLFLTESGVNKMADIRASSLQNAIRFAKNWNLFGIVSDAVPFILCPRLASVVKASGLACFTYGSANNDPENAKLEIAAGVDAVIVDSVLAVRKELTKYEETLKNLKLSE